MYKVGDVVADEYVVEKVFPNGGMGLVYRVRRSGWDMDLALKQPRKELFQDAKQRESFVKECETWMDLGVHPNVVSCYYVWIVDSVPSYSWNLPMVVRCLTGFVRVDYMMEVQMPRWRESWT